METKDCGADSPPLETMLDDLSKVEGLGWVFQMLAMVASIDPSQFTPAERRIVEGAAPTAPAPPE